MTASHSWAGFISVVVNRSVFGHQSILLVLKDTWGYSGLITGLAVIGAVTTFGLETGNALSLLALLAGTAFVVPAVRLHDQTTWSLDEHLAYGIWFATIAAGYACSKLIRWLPGARRQLPALCCAVALAYPAAASWQSAWQRYHAWPDAGSFITAIEPIAAQSHGLIYVPGNEVTIAKYYAPHDSDWTRWTSALPPDRTKLMQSVGKASYPAQLHSGKYEVIVLFYSTTFSSSPELPGRMLLPSQASSTYQQLLSLVGDNSEEPDLPALTLALAKDPRYGLKAVGHTTPTISPALMTMASTRSGRRRSEHCHAVHGTAATPGSQLGSVPAARTTSAAPLAALSAPTDGHLRRAGRAVVDPRLEQHSVCG